MQDRWTRFEDDALQSRLIGKATELCAPFSTSTDGRIWFDHEEWCRHGDPQILTLDDEFGPEWVAVHADEPKQRLERVRYLKESGIHFVVWSDAFNGTSIVLKHSVCPVDWECA